MVSSTPRPHFTPGKEPVPIVQEAACAPGSVWRAENLAPTGIRSPDPPARSKSLYRLSYLAHNNNIFFLLWRCDPRRVMASSFLRFLDHTQRRTTVYRTPLDKSSGRRRDLYLTTHNTHNRQTSKLPVGFEPTISAGERPQTYALDREATGTGYPHC